MTDTQQVTPLMLLTEALDVENQPLTESLAKSILPFVGVDYLIIELQRYLIKARGMGTLTEGARDIALDILNPLYEAQKTLHDATYVAPNLSPEVAELLLYCAGPLVKAGLDHMTPGWVMIPQSEWGQLLRLAKAAVERHAD